MSETPEEMTPAQQRMAHARAARNPPELVIRSAVLLTGMVMGRTLTYVTTTGADIPNGEAMDSITPHVLGLIFVHGAQKAMVPWSRVVSCELA